MDLHQWYYRPGEQLRGVGFYLNPYKQYYQAEFRHIFAFDGNYNLYVGVHSIYQKHIDHIFDLKDKREYGLIYPVDNPIKPKHSYAEYNDRAAMVIFDFLETKNIMYLNKRLKPISQRFYDYGLPADTLLASPNIDLWHLTIGSVLKNSFLERPTA